MIGLLDHGSRGKALSSMFSFEGDPSVWLRLPLTEGLLGNGTTDGDSDKAGLNQFPPRSCRTTSA